VSTRISSFIYACIYVNLYANELGRSEPLSKAFDREWCVMLYYFYLFMLKTFEVLLVYCAIRTQCCATRNVYLCTYDPRVLRCPPPELTGITRLLCFITLLSFHNIFNFKKLRHIKRDNTPASHTLSTHTLHLDSTHRTSFERQCCCIFSLPGGGGAASPSLTCRMSLYTEWDKQYYLWT